MSSGANVEAVSGLPVSGARISIIVPALGAGGTEHVVSLVANHWVRIGCVVTLITQEAPAAKPYYEFDPSVSIERIGLPPQKASKLQAAWLVTRRIQRLRAAIRRSRPDFVLSFLTRTNVLALLATTGLPYPVVVSERNNPELQPFGPLWKWLQARLYPRAFGLVTMTSGALDYFPWEVRRKGWVIANAVNLPSGWKKRRGNNTLTAVGRLTWQKGFDLLLQAFAKVAPKHPDWKLVIWGEGEARKELEDLRDQLGLTERVELPGVTARPGLWVETADVFVLSSRYEGWGIALLEAMASGVPVVSFACEWGPTDMVRDGENGILVSNGDVDALAEALSNVLENDALRARLGANAEASARKYSAENILAQWDTIARSALNHRTEFTISLSQEGDSLACRRGSEGL
ncbi:MULTISPECIES: glycosyltransferase family 4 protein [unclassified Ensifer]|uniref:glycosyltransferase family 4 protein n=1 Tax=unclassified Ensifer TaxID=2633371 RepID=UPI0007150A1F|nr:MULTISPECIES: glycosyltransferase family 4 protein [unclassified Ensifer]KQX16431.1 amylovoran biosynthesis protein AmsD [Ensifer sp. Root423]KQZ54349.1 amylovoran biosynthesis protein AmsD [Ensifer sp. Root558]